MSDDGYPRDRYRAGPQIRIIDPLAEFFTGDTSPEVRFLARTYAPGGLPRGLPKLRTINGLYAALGLVLFNEGIRAPGTETWNFMLQTTALGELEGRAQAFHARDEAWPVEHKHLQRVSPYVWAGSYHPRQPRRSPLLHFEGLDHLTAWAMNMTDEVPETAPYELDAALASCPGLRVWLERKNILALPLPSNSDVPTVMDQRYEMMDAPLLDPAWTGRNARAALPERVPSLDTIPSLRVPVVPFSNAKRWCLLDARPMGRWSLQTLTRRPKDLAAWRKNAPRLQPFTGKRQKNAVEVGGLYFPTLLSSAMYFRIPYETVKARLRRGWDLVTALEMDPLYYQNTGAVRKTTYASHWHRVYRGVNE